MAAALPGRSHQTFAAWLHFLREPSGCSTDEPTQSQKSLLDVLKYPDPSMLARKRAITCKPPVGVKKGKGIALKSDPKSVSTSERLKEFPNECLKLNFSRKLFCEACI